jgi:hypothetical protein
MSLPLPVVHNGGTLSYFEVGTLADGTELALIGDELCMGHNGELEGYFKRTADSKKELLDNLI